MRKTLLMLAALSLAVACSPAAASKGEAAGADAATAETADGGAAKASTDATPAAPEARIEPVAARGKRVELVNDARRGALVRLEIAPIENRERFREVVAARGLPPSEDRDVRFGPGCVYDTRARMADGSTLRQYRVDVCFRNRVFLGDWPAEGEPPMASGQAPQ